MAAYLITGMSGAGKSTLLTELTGRGHRTLDTDYGGWKYTDSLWDEARMAALLATNPDIFISGTAENQGKFYHYFAQVILLHAPLPILLARIAQRTNNPYGKTASERNEVIHNYHSITPLLRQGATLELDAQRPVSDLADELEALGLRA